MKKYRNIIFIMLFGLVACDPPGTDILYSEMYIEVEAATTVTGADFFTYLRINDGQNIPSGFLVTLAATAQPSPVNFTFEIDPESTAEEGTHFMLSGNSATIPANGFSAELPIEIIDDNINAGEQWTIVVNIVSSDVPVNPNYESGTHVIQVSCPSALGGTYTTVATGTSTDGCCLDEITVESEVTLTDEGDGVYTISDWSANMYLTWYEIYGISAETDMTTKLTDICSTISGSFNEPFGQTASLEGSLDESTGVITYNWESGWGDKATVVLTPK